MSNETKEKVYANGVLMREFSTKFGPALELYFVNEMAFMDFFTSKMGMYKGGLKLTAFRKKVPTDHSTHYIILNEGLDEYRHNIESDFSESSENHMSEIDDTNPF